MATKGTVSTLCCLFNTSALRTDIDFILLCTWSLTAFRVTTKESNKEHPATPSSRKAAVADHGSWNNFHVSVSILEQWGLGEAAPFDSKLNLNVMWFVTSKVENKTRGIDTMYVERKFEGNYSRWFQRDLKFRSKRAVWMDSWFKLNELWECDVEILVKQYKLYVCIVPQAWGDLDYTHSPCVSGRPLSYVRGTVA